MFFYRLKKLLKEKKREVFLGSLQISFIASFVSQFFILFMWSEEFSRREKWQMSLFSFLLTIFSLITINFVNEHFNFNILVCIFVSVIINFLIYIIPAMILIIILEWSDVTLTKDEIRDAKLDKVLRKLF